jgi:hypothetical protein
MSGHVLCYLASDVVDWLETHADDTASVKITAHLYRKPGTVAVGVMEAEPPSDDPSSDARRTVGRAASQKGRK